MSLAVEMAGHWEAFLMGIGLSAEYLTNRHGPCPMCGGKDRFRYDNREGKGTWICSHCGAGTGYKLAMLATGWDTEKINRELARFLRGGEIGAKPKIVPKRKSTWPMQVLEQSKPLTGSDPVSVYLANRGLSVPNPCELRWCASLPYYVEQQVVAKYAAMIAPVVGPDGEFRTVHVTYLQNGRKAEVPSAKKLLTAVGAGSSARLMPRGIVLGVAEGIETALAAWMLFRVPTWAALTAIGLEKWEPVGPTREVVVYADNDASMTGQAAAYALAKRLRGKGIVCNVALPPKEGTDWADVLTETRSTPATAT